MKISTLGKLSIVHEGEQMKKALIVANLAGFASFLMNDFDILAGLGYQIDFAANTEVLPWDGTKQELVKKGIRTIQIDFDSKKPVSFNNLKAYFQIAKLLNSQKYDLIHCHTPIVGLLTRVAKIRNSKENTKIVYTTHGLSYTSKSSFWKKCIYRTIEDFCSCLTDAIITINKEDFSEVKKMHCKNVFYIPGVGVNTERFSAAFVDRYSYRKSINVYDDEIMVLSVGELSTRKNHSVIIDALAMLKEDTYVYVVCGNGINGGTAQELEKNAKENNVRLILLGFRNDIPEIMKCSDIGAIPSIREGLGLAGVQSLAAGIPLVGSNVQGIKDYIVDGETGYLCDPTDASTFAKGIYKLTKQIQKTQFPTRKCVEMARQFDIAISREKMKEIYLNILLST